MRLGALPGRRLLLAPGGGVLPLSLGLLGRRPRPNLLFVLCDLLRVLLAGLLLLGLLLSGRRSGGLLSVRLVLGRRQLSVCLVLGHGLLSVRLVLGRRLRRLRRCQLLCLGCRIGLGPLRPDLVRGLPSFHVSLMSRDLRVVSHGFGISSGLGSRRRRGRRSDGQAELLDLARMIPGRPRVFPGAFVIIALAFPGTSLAAAVRAVGLAVPAAF